MTEDHMLRFNYDQLLISYGQLVAQRDQMIAELAQLRRTVYDLQVQLKRQPSAD